MFPQVSLPLDHPRATAFVRQHFEGLPVLTIPRSGNMPAGQCYQNCRGVVAKSGGTIQAGWLLTWYPDHYIEALHHAVWKSPDGKLVDVTGPAYPLMTDNKVYFIEDTIRSIGTTNPIVASIFEQLDNCAGTKQFIEHVINRMELAAIIEDRINNLPRTVVDGKIFIDAPLSLVALKDTYDCITARINDYANRFIGGNFDRI